ncbi:AIR synthase-related protein [[Eubacterium] cellulosolvens]
MGKFASKKLTKIIRCIEPSERVILPPRAGCDAGVYESDKDHYMVVSTDPCTGVPKDWFGWLLIHYSASDVALFGAKPMLASINLLGPPKISYMAYKRIMDQACKAAKDLKIDIITGHTGNYPSLLQIIGVCTMHGFVRKENLITPAGSQPEDCILMIKPLGLETLTNFSLTHYEVSKKLLGLKATRRLRSMVRYQTCVEEALLLSKYGGVHALHDITEGGLVAALNEMADGSNLGFKVDYKSLPIINEVKLLQKHFRLALREVLSLSSTGSLLASISFDMKEEAIDALRKKGFSCAEIGKFTSTKMRCLDTGKMMCKFFSEAKDPYNKIFYSS